MKRIHQLLGLGFSLLVMMVLITSCSKDEALSPDNQVDERGFTLVGTGKNVNFYALSDRDELLRYKAGPPVSLVSSTAIRGLEVNEHILSMDFRPSTGVLYGVSNLSIIYIISTESGQLKPIGKALEPLLRGSFVGFDFDPRNDVIHITTNEGQNLSVDPNSLAVLTVDTDLSPVGVAVTASAFARVRSATGGYPMYDIDASRGVLLLQSPAESGVTTIVGSLGLFISGEGGFDIPAAASSHTVGNAGNNNSGFAVLYGHSASGGIINGDNLAADASRVWEINLTTGKATYKGVFDRNIIGIAIQ